MASQNYGAFRRRVLGPASPICQKPPGKSSRRFLHDQLLLEKILRIAMATPYFNWDAVAQLVKEHPQYGKGTDLGTMFKIYAGRVLIPQIARNRSALSKVPQELWDTVNKFLPSLTGRYAAQTLDFALAEGHRRHSDIWSKIFKEGAPWDSIATDRRNRNLALLGDNLHSLWDDPEGPAYLALVRGNKCQPTGFWSDKLLDSFKAHDLKNGGREIVFKESHITLNVEAFFDDIDDILCEPKNLVSYQYQH